MKNILTELQRVWDAKPNGSDIDNYAFVISWDWEDAPTEFQELPVYRFRPLPNQMIYLMPNPMWKNCEYDEKTND
jgi:hypothetical protein